MELVGPEPSSAALWRDVLVPVAVMAVIVAGLAGGAVMAAGQYPTPWPARSWTVNISAAAAWVFVLMAVAARAWQNAGVVTVVRYDGRRLSWTSRTLWGGRTRSWPAASIERVWVDRVAGRRAVLKVKRRRWGVPLAAFSWRRVDDVRGAADVLAQAVFRTGLGPMKGSPCGSARISPQGESRAERFPVSMRTFSLRSG